jgi:hypothetical protein
MTAPLTTSDRLARAGVLALSAALSIAALVWIVRALLP